MRIQVRYPDSIEAGVEASGFEKLPITLHHAERAAAPPPHHADLFDRMLVAQAEVESLTLVTHDRALAAHGRPVMWA